MPKGAVEMDLADEAATVALAGALAPLARPGDVLALGGGLGAGKTVFARAFIHARTGNHGAREQEDREEVPSPTFTLVQVYDLAGGAVYHFDLFRIRAPEEAWELGIEEAFAEGISLIEWPDRLGALLPSRRLEVNLDFADRALARRAVIAGGGDWPGRLEEAGLA